MIKPSSLNEKFPGLRTPSPSPRHLRQAIDLIGLIKRVYYLVALAWVYGWVKAIGLFIESLDSVVKKRRSEEEKGGCPPKKRQGLVWKKPYKKLFPARHPVPKLLHETPAAPGMAFAPSALPSSGQKKRRPPPGERSSYPIKKGGLAPPLESIAVVKTRSCKRRSAGPSRRPASCRNRCGSCASRCRRPSCSRCNPVPGWLPGFRRSGSC